MSGFRLRVKFRRTAVALAEAVSRPGQVRLKADTTEITNVHGYRRRAVPAEAGAPFRFRSSLCPYPYEK